MRGPGGRGGSSQGEKTEDECMSSAACEGEVRVVVVGERFRPLSRVVLCAGTLGGWYLGVGRGAVWRFNSYSYSYSHVSVLINKGRFRTNSFWTDWLPTYVLVGSAEVPNK